MTRNQRSYYAVIRELKASYGVTHTQARKIRSALTYKLGSAPRLKDLKEHPIITSRAVKSVTKPEKGIKVKGGGDRGGKREKGGGGRVTTINSISQWEDFLSDYDGRYDDYEYDDTGEYKENV